MIYTVGEGLTFTVDLTVAVFDEGWTKMGAFAHHEGCNPGRIFNESLIINTGTSYTITWEVTEYTDGNVQAFIGNVGGTARTALGIYSDIIVAPADHDVYFYSNGNLTIRMISIEETSSVDSVTIVFDDKLNRFHDEYSYVPEFYDTTGEGMVVFKNGELYTHRTNDTHNNFFGVQYASKIRVVFNINPTTVKQFYSLRIQSKGLWFAEHIVVKGHDGKPELTSRLKANRFVRKQGDYFADFLRNIDDPRFVDPNVALFQGEKMIGKTIEILLINEETIEQEIFEIDVKSASAPHTY